MLLPVVAGLIVPLVLGWLLMAAMRYAADVHAIERWAVAWLLGAAGLGTVMVCMGRAGLPVTRAAILTAVGVVAVAAVVVRHFRVKASLTANGSAGASPSHEASLSRTLPNWCWLVVLLIALRIAWVVAEAIIVPEHLFDAFDFWLLRARNIALLGHVPTDPESPFYLGGGKYDYPLGVPMLAAWPVLLHGEWDERIISLMWPPYFVSLLALAGGVTARRTSAPVGLLVAYVLSSIPLIGVHAVRSGYADLPLAAHLLAGCLASWDAVESRRRGAWPLAIANALFCVLIKREGLLLMTIWGAGILIGGWPRFTWAARRAVAAGAAVLAIAATAGSALTDLNWVRRELATVGWHPEAILHIRYRLFAWDSWNLTWWIAAPLLPWAAWRLWRRGQGVAVAQVIGLLLFTLSVFLFSANAAFAVMGYTLDRSMMQIAPVALCMLALALGKRLGNVETPRLPDQPNADAVHPV